MRWVRKFHRRQVLRFGAAAAFGATGTLRAATVAPKATACILIWLDGGPSHLDTFDPKPDAPADVRGPFRPISTSVPGTAICELLPLTARLADRLAIVRSMTSPLGEHGIANRYLLTGTKPGPVLEYPSFGSVVGKLRGGRPVLPPYVAVPNAGLAGGPGYLGAEHRPFETGGDPADPRFRVRDLEPYLGVTAAGLARRRDFLADFDRLEAAAERADFADPTFEQAFRLATSPEARRAFGLQDETPAVQTRYGSRTLGRSCLLARRLVERGVPFVTVFDSGWDTHDGLVLRLRDGYSGAKVGVGLLPTFDQAFSALLTDLDERGLLASTLVVAMGEFGRTPKPNARGGRDHWPRVFSVVLAGGGIVGGRVLGRSDRIGESPLDDPVTPADLARTLFALLGIDPELRLTGPGGRPVPLAEEGAVLRQLL